MRFALTVLVTLGLVACGEGPNETCVDADGDGFGEGVCIAADCNDADANAHPGLAEVVGNGVDENCDGAETCFLDMDGDGFRVATELASIDLDCDDAMEALPSAAFDCNDDAEEVNGGLPEIIADGIDQDCDGAELCYANRDDDGYRTTATLSASDLDCTDPGEALPALPMGDCDNDVDTVFPGASEVVGDGVDQDCDTDETCHVDADHDGTRTAATLESDDLDCADLGEALPAAMLDCADLPAADPNCGNGNGNACSPLVANDDCNGGIDNDCDTLIDEDQLTWYADDDADSFGSSSATMMSCAQPAGHVADGTDCDDDDPTVWAQQSRFKDDDSDGSGTGSATPACEGESVALGFAVAGGDCDDGDATTRVGAAELPDDGDDQDCADGDLVMSDATGIFVAPPPTGDDANAGTMAAPVATIFAGHQKASASQALYIADGTYSYDNVVSDLQRSMYGGYSSDFTSRGDGSGTIIEFDGSISIGAAPVALERLELHVVDTVNSSSKALTLPSGSNVTLRDVTISSDGSFGSFGVDATDATLVIEGSDISVGDANLCTAVSSRGGRLVVARSHIESCAAQNAGGSSIGILVTRTIGTNDPGLATIVGNVIETDPVGGIATSIGVGLYGTRTRVLVANNTIHLGPSVGAFSPSQVGIDISSTATYSTFVVALNNLITATDGGSTAVGLDTGAPVVGYSVMRNNDIFLDGTSDCIVLENGSCISNTDALTCNFSRCHDAAGNITVDPQYTDALRHIDAASMCVNGGLDFSAVAPGGLVSTDFDGDPRSLATIDIGADEYTP